jgi:ankyrin repeat protein
MLVRGADPDAQDTNGNTVLHLLVILEKLVIKYIILKNKYQNCPGASTILTLFGMYQTI